MRGRDRIRAASGVRSGPGLGEHGTLAAPGSGRDRLGGVSVTVRPFYGAETGSRPPPEQSRPRGLGRDRSGGASVTVRPFCGAGTGSRPPPVSPSSPGPRRDRSGGAPVTVRSPQRGRDRIRVAASALTGSGYPAGRPHSNSVLKHGSDSREAGSSVSPLVPKEISRPGRQRNARRAVRPSDKRGGEPSPQPPSNS